MARIRTAKFPKVAEIEPEEESQEIPDEEPAVIIEPEPVAAQPTMSKADACRAALAAGIDNAEEAMEFTLNKFGVEIKATDFSLYKSKGKQADTAAPAKRGPKPKIEPEPAGNTMNKSEAARAAIDAGYDKPGTAVDYIKEQFGVEIGAQHFSAIKSQYLKAQATAKPKGAPGRKPKVDAPVVEGYVAPPVKPKTPGEPDVLLALEGIKDLVGQFGADRVKRMVDLIG